MKDRKRLKPGLAAGLMLGLSLLYGALVLLSCAGTAAASAPRVEAATAPERVLTGEDETDRVALELLPGERVDVNTASREELKRLPGIGETLADAIVREREEHGPFAAPEDLLRVPGIGEKRLAAIRDQISFDLTPEESNDHEAG